MPTRLWTRTAICSKYGTSSAQAFDEGVILRCLVLPSFHDEYAVGLHVKRERAEAFVLEPSSWIWNTELVRLRQNGEIKDVTGLGKEMKVIPPEKSEALKKLKEKTPADYRSIKATRRARVLPRDLADEIEVVWKEMLLDVRHPKEPILGNDGVIYHFSARLEWRGEISGHTWSPDPDSRTGRLTSLADALGDYARKDRPERTQKETGSNKGIHETLAARTRTMSKDWRDFLRIVTSGAGRPTPPATPGRSWRAAGRRWATGG